MASLKRTRNSNVSVEPSMKDELAINPKKVKELSDHLEKYKITQQGTVLILIGPSGSGKTTAIKVLSNHLNLQLTTWSPKDLEDSPQSYNTQLLIYLQSICSIKKPLRFPGCSPKSIPSIILIDSPPTSYTDPGREDWTSCLRSILSYSSKLICIIMSEASKKTIEKHFNHIPYTLIQFSRPAKMFIFKAIDRLNSIFQCFCSQESMHQASNGNLSKLVNLMTLNKDVYKVKAEGADDYEFQFFHTLGKFLYNKSKKYSGLDDSGKPRRMNVDELRDKNTRPRLYFDPEDLIDRCQCEQEFFWLYLEENFWEFFSDVNDCQELLGYCQLADQLDNYRNAGYMHRENAVPSYLVARAVMDCNLHPTNIKKMYTMKAPMANALRERVKMLALDIQTEAAMFGVSKECYVTEMKFFERREMMRLGEEEADDDFLWQEINNGIGNINVQ